MMQRKRVKSSNIRSVGYDKATKILEVEFKNRAVYRYEKVTPKVYDRLMLSESVGSELHRSIIPFFKASKELQKERDDLNEARRKMSKRDELPKGHVRAHRVVRVRRT